MKIIPRIILILVLLFAFGAGLALAQNPTPPPTPTPSPTPSLLPKPVSDATDYWHALVQTYGAPIALGAVILAMIVAALLWLSKAIAGGASKSVAAETQRRIAEIERRLAQDTHLQEYLANSIDSAFSFLDLKSLDERGGYDTDVRLREVYIPLRARGTLPEERVPKGAREMPFGEREPRAPELTEWLARAPRLVVVGRAGSGKSTFLKYVALILADAWRQNNPALVQEKLKVTFDPLPVPIYFPLREFGVYWTNVVKPEEKTQQLQAHALLRFLAHNFSRYGLDTTYFEKLLKQGQCLIFLDGLDEVKLDLRPALVEVVEAFVREFRSTNAAHPNRYVVACRPEAYRGVSALRQFQEVTIEPLDDEQVQNFVPQWYREVLRRNNRLTPEAEQEAREKSRTLLQAIAEKPQVRELTDTPLLLTLVAMLHHRAQLPDSRVELYHDCTRLLLDKWEKSRPGEQGRQVFRDLTPPEVPEELERRREFLQPAAFWLLQAGLPAAPKADWAREIVTRLQLPGDPTEAQRRVEIFLEWANLRCNILEETDDDVYRFTHHRTFQEYLAAGYLVSREEEGITTALDLVTDRDWWETLRLMVAATRNTKRRSDFLCRALDRPEPEAALLVGSCLAELRDPYLDPAILDDVKQKLLAAMTDVRLSAKDTRAPAGELLGRLGDPRADVNAPFPVVVFVPGGEYWIGSREDSGDSDEHPRHPVRLNDFWIAKYPVTNAQYKLFVDAHGYENKDYWTPKGWAWRQGKYTPDYSQIDTSIRERYRKWVEGRKIEERARPYWWNDRKWNLDNHPVVGITWFEVMAYCAWLTEQFKVADSKFQVWQNGQLETLNLKPETFQARLPTEAEWEAAARGRAEYAYPWSNDFDSRFANTMESDIERTTAVGQYPEGASPFGALDMAGNVWEWCHSLYKPYPYRADDGREDENSDAFRVLRGGSWLSPRDGARAAYRYRLDPVFFDLNVGVRVVFSPKGSGF